MVVGVGLASLNNRLSRHSVLVFFRHLLGGQEVELVLPATDNDGVSCVGSDGDAGTDIVFLRLRRRALFVPIVVPIYIQRWRWRWIGGERGETGIGTDV